LENNHSLAELNRQLVENQFQLQTILKMCPVGIGVTRLRDGVIVEFNDALLAIIGFERHEVLGRNSCELGFWADPEVCTQIFARLTAGETVQDFEKTVRRKDGSLRQTLFSATLIQLGGDDHLVGTLRDITLERTLEYQRADAIKDLQIILDHMPSMIGYWDSNQRNKFGNHAYLDWFGIDPKTMPGMTIREVIGEKLYRLNLPYIEAALRGEKQIFERLIPAPDGLSVRHSLAEYLPDAVDGEIRGFFAIVTDVSSITEAQIALRASEARYRSVVQDQTEVIARYRKDGSLVFVNDFFCRFFGKSEAELLGQSWHPVAHPDDVLDIESKVATISSENPVVVIENRVFGADGNQYWMQFINRGLFDDDGQLREIQSVGRDISERKRAEEKLAASRTELRALLAANDDLRENQRKEIAQNIHDQLGALLIALNFRSDILAHQVKGNLPLAVEVSRIKSLVTEASNTAREICNNIRPPQLDDLGLIPTCRWYLKDWSRLVGIAAKGRFSALNKEMPAQLSTDLFRVFQELLTNVARHASATAVRVNLSSTSKALRLQVSDDGCGFSPDSKSPGFGLAGIRERLTRYAAQVAIASGPNGTTVSITIAPQVKK
jgi:PAS domain S-box-containing protein